MPTKTKSVASDMTFESVAREVYGKDITPEELLAELADISSAVVYKTAHVEQIIKWADMYIQLAKEQKSRHFRDTEADKKIVANADTRIAFYTELREVTEALLHAT